MVKQLGQKLSRFTYMIFRKERSVGRLLGSRIDRARPATHMSDETGCWFDHARRSDRYKNRAFIERTENLVQFKRHFSEPANVRTNRSAAAAARQLGWELVQRAVGKRQAAA